MIADQGLAAQRVIEWLRGTVIFSRMMMGWFATGRADPSSHGKQSVRIMTRVMILTLLVVSVVSQDFLEWLKPGTISYVIFCK